MIGHIGLGTLLDLMLLFLSAMEAISDNLNQDQKSVYDKKIDSFRLGYTMVRRAL